MRTMIYSFICGSAAGLALLTALYTATILPLPGWASLNDTLLRVGVVGILSLISLISASIGLYVNEPYKNYLIVMVVLTAIPATAFIIFVGIILSTLI